MLVLCSIGTPYWLLLVLYSIIRLNTKLVLIRRNAKLHSIYCLVLYSIDTYVSVTIMWYYIVFLCINKSVSIM